MKEANMQQSSELEGPQPVAPSLAKILFDGTDLTGWSSRKGGDAGWKIENQFMEVVPGSGDIYTRESFGDFQLHLEFWLPYMPDKEGQARANSGVYLQGRYEIQVLDSYGLEPRDNYCGAIYKVAAPLVNACEEPGRWQSYDVAFKSARCGRDGRITDSASVTVFQNGIMIHNNLEVPRPTGGALDEDMGKNGPLLLQDHGDLVRYRNIWIITS